MLYKMRNDEFEKVYAIMVEAFPIDERRTFDEQIALLDNPSFEILVWKDAPSGEIDGFISLYRFEDLVFVEHFAVANDKRNCGLGKRILDELPSRERRICLEVEPPITEQAKHRIAFYERNGFYLNEYSYIQPPISKNTCPIPLLIMTSGEAVDYETFLNIKRVLYENVYGVDENAY